LGIKQVFFALIDSIFGYLCRKIRQASVIKALQAL